MFREDNDPGAPPRLAVKHYVKGKHLPNETTECDQYVSYPTDGKMLRAHCDAVCEWCGKAIPINQLAVQRAYRDKAEYFDTLAYQHLTCYDKLMQRCEERGHDVNRFAEQPIWVLR